MNMNIESELTPVYTNQKSFYGKAVTKDTPLNIELFSYNTLVASIFKETGKAEVYNLQSQTTLKHVKDFLKQNGFTADTKSQIIDLYWRG